MRLQPWLYYKRELSEKNYSHTPSDQIDPSRLLTGLPAFVNQKEAVVYHRKTLAGQEHQSLNS